ncbi:MAG: tetratricopeptide repeat protein [Prevotellaceae bacterium]|nr:tetratricopeptide repeat protein [Prevotellaceae bacterium]
MGMMLILVTACSTQKNTGKTRFWHSFSAKYNTYYNGTLAYIDGSLEKEKGNKDNYTELIPLYTVGNKQSQKIGAGNFDRAIEKSEKTIKLHSIKKRPEWNKKRRKTEKDIEWLSRREYNPMMWKAWMLMGRSQFHKGEFDASAATFAYMSRLYQTQPAIYGKARAWLAKSYIEEGWLYDAEDVIRNMSRDSLHWSARKEWDYTYADYYIHTAEYDKAIPYLKKVIKHEMRKKQKAREYFLLGQLYAKTGNNTEAYKAYKRVIRQNPPYELEFNARIAMTEVMAQGQSKQMISRLKRMARNENNKDYLDQVYYAIGNIYMLQKDTTNAVIAYEKGNKKATRAGVEKGVLLLRLGDIYWDMEKYSDAARCYGEAIGLLDKERDDYKQLADRSKKLDQLVPYTDAIHLQDSLQELAKMSEKDRNEAIDRVINELKRKEKEEKDRLAEENAARVQGQNGAQNGRQNTPTTPNNQRDANGQWYFYNQMTVNQGKQAFQKTWGKRENADHWRRSNQTVVNFNDDADLDLTDEQRDSIAAMEAELAKQAEEDSLANDPHKREYYLAQIPFTEEQVEASNLIIMDGLYNSGVIFKDKLDNLILSERQFQRLETQYPTFENMADAYYHMFLLYSRMEQPGVAQGYIEKLKNAYPDSKWTTLLTDPYFVENQQFGVQIEDSLYAATYNAFKADRFSEVKTNTRLSAERFPLGANRDKFVFIGGLSKLNAGDSDGCLEDMNTVVKDFPQSKLATMAGMIVNGVKEGKKLRGGRFDIGDVWARRSAVMNDSDSIAARQFVPDRDIEFVFMIAYQPDSVNENQLLYELAKYNFTSYMVRNFGLEIEDQDGLHVMKVDGFNNYDEALEYAHQLYQQQSVVQRLGKSRSIIISAKNRELLGVNFSYDDYDKYYDENFLPFGNPNMQRLMETVDSGRDLDDGGSVPRNISPILLPKQEVSESEGDSDGEVNGEGDYEIESDSDSFGGDFEIEEEALAAPSDNNTVVIEEESPSAPAVSPVPSDDSTVVIEEDSPSAPAVSPVPSDDSTVVIEEESPAAPPVPSDDIIVIDEEETPAVDSDEIIIIEDEPAPAGATDDDEIIILDDDTPESVPSDDIIVIADDDDSDSEGTEDEYYELDGF